MVEKGAVKECVLEFGVLYLKNKTQWFLKKMGPLGQTLSSLGIWSKGHLFGALLLCHTYFFVYSVNLLTRDE